MKALGFVLEGLPLGLQQREEWLDIVRFSLCDRT